ncbi:MAG: molecular chaperone HtpG [Faecalibacterium prausnitzii]|nr:MAG: molecular chaperone HtpG [Faecalibacterium prausnitzii]
MAKKEFQAESKKLMDMMINSIYTNKEIFLRELISNASDAIDKLYYKSLTDPSVGMNKGDFRILITRDKDNRILTIEDNGIGMTKEELEQNLGTIAHSGSLDFKKDNKDENIDIIGQFGVGFYSSFMVADKVTVISKAYGSDEAWQWESSGVDGYEMTPAQKDTAGTQIILHIKPDTETDHYDNFLDEYGIVAIVKKYSDYVRYPIQMERQHERQKPEPDPKPEDYKPEWESYTELETLNSMVPIWKKQKSEVTDEEYASFYKEKFNDYTDPARVIVSRTEGTANYNALLFVPSHRPYDFYTKDYEKGLALYASGVLIMEKCADLLPDYFSFVKGIVDSQDLSLNISREMLQKDNQLKLIHNALEKKIKNELHAMLANDRQKYEEFWKEFGRQIKFGAYSDYGMHAELLRDLLLFWSAKEQKMVMAKLPAAELVMDKGYDVLLLTEDVDEFCLQILRSYPRKDAEGKDGTVEFKNVNSGDLGLETEEEKKAAEDATAENKALFDTMKDALDGKVKEVKVSTRLKDHPVCLSADGPLSIEMEKVLSKQPGSEGVKSDKVLELNVNHPVFAVLKAAQEAGDTDKLKKYSALLYAQAQLIEGLPVDDPAAYAEAVCSLMK